VSTGTATGVQTADAAGVQSTDLTDTFVNARCAPIAGQQDIAMQLLDQSPVSFDEIVFADLIADYNAKKLDIAGHQRLRLGRAGDRHPQRVGHQRDHLHRRVADAAGDVGAAAAVGIEDRQEPQAARHGVVLTPSMWYWALSQLDTTTGR
jgi:hypothetical protein